MGKVKVKKQDVFIDMTPMSDVMVLLLTFFMLTSTFVKDEPVKVLTPGSVSEIKVPETNVLSVLVDDKGKIFLEMDKPADMQSALEGMASAYDMKLSPKQIETFRKAQAFGVSMNDMDKFLSLKSSELNAFQKDKGLPLDSIEGGMSEFQLWIEQAMMANPEFKIAIKADERTPYKDVKKIMSELQDMNENRYYLITSLKTEE